MHIALRQAKYNYWANKLDNECGDTKQAWRIINNILRRNNQQDDTISEIKLDIHVVSSPEDIDNQFNECFSNIGPSLGEKLNYLGYGHDKFIPRSVSSIHFKTVNVSKVYKLLSSLSLSKATGIEKISARVIRVASRVIS